MINKVLFTLDVFVELIGLYSIYIYLLNPINPEDKF